MSAPYWEHPEYREARRRRTAAYVALVSGTRNCPRYGTEGFDEYQATTMEPLREALRAAIAALDATIKRLRGASCAS